MKARLAQVEAVLAEVQGANRRLEDMPHAQRNARSLASDPRSCRPTSSICHWKMPNWPRACSLRRRRKRPRRHLRGAGAETTREPRRNRGQLPPHLPRIERVIEPASTQCPCGCGEMARIGEVEEDQGNGPGDRFPDDGPNG